MIIIAWTTYILHDTKRRLQYLTKNITFWYWMNVSQCFIIIIIYNIHFVFVVFRFYFSAHKQIRQIFHGLITILLLFTNLIFIRKKQSCHFRMYNYSQNRTKSQLPRFIVVQEIVNCTNGQRQSLLLHKRSAV